MTPPRSLAALLAVALVLAACSNVNVDSSRAPISNRTPAVSTAPHASQAASPGSSPESSPESSPAGPPASASATDSPSPPPTGIATTPPQAFDPERVELAFEPFAAGFGALTFVTHAGDGSGLLYAVEQRGRILIVEADGTARRGPFLDISNRVRAGGEQGLLGLAFHPDYAANGRFFVNYTDQVGDTVVAEFGSRGAEADAASERVVLHIDQPFANHNGGMIAFGPDSQLYIATGDGGGGGDPFGHGQNLGSLLGKMLRIDIDAQAPYAIPANNPFAMDTPTRPEIWALGLRNPWRFSFDRQTGALFVGDVGQGRWEEIDAEAAAEGGRNYGWNLMEGPDCFRDANCDTTGLTPPVAWYGRQGNCAVTGGYVYRGQRSPALAGAYLFADYCSGLVWGLDAATALTDGTAEATELGSSEVNPSSFGEDEAGELYLVGHDGRILRIVAR